MKDNRMKILKKTLNSIWSFLILASLVLIIVFAFLKISLIAKQIVWYISCAVMISSFFQKRKTKDKFEVWENASTILIIAIFGGCFIINTYQTAFNWYWYGFVLAATITVIITICFAIMAWNNSDKSKLTKKHILAMALKLVSFYLLLDLFYMSFIINSLPLKFVFGILVVLIILYSLSISFLGTSKFPKWFLVQDFVIGIGLTIYLIFIIPNADLQTVVTAIVAAVYGGLLTLIGVAWTIKHSDKQKREDELAKAKPMFTFNLISKAKTKDVSNQKVCLANSKIGIESILELENSDKSSFTINRFFYDHKWHSTVVNNIVLPNSQLIVQLYRQDLIEHPIMEIKDIYGRKFYYDLMFLCMPPLQPVQFCTLGELKEITLQELQTRNIPIE